MQYTKTPHDVYSPVDGAGNARGASMGDALVLAQEMIADIASKASGEDLAGTTSSLQQGIGEALQAVSAETQARQAADENLSTRIAAISGPQKKEAVAFATTGNIALTGTQTVDGVASGNGLRALVRGQTNATQNGLYLTASSGAWTRATDADSGAKLLGATVYVLAGAANGGKTFGLATVAPITVGTTPLTFVQTSGDPDGIAGAVDDLETEVFNARQSEPSLSDRLAIIAADAVFSRDGTYAALTQALVDARRWGISPRLSFPAIAGLRAPSWIQFSRSSGATFVDSGGVVRTAIADVLRHDYDPDTGAYLGLLLECESTTNRFLYSDQFANAAWTKTNTTVVTNAVVSPDGGTTADKIVETSASSTHLWQQSVALNPGVKNNWSGWFKKASERQVRLRVFSNPNTTVATGVTFNPETGDFTNPTAQNGASHSYSAKRYKNGWWRVSYSYTLGGADTAALMRVELANNSGNTNYAGDGSSGVYAWGFQSEARDFVSSYVRSEASATTRERDLMSATGLAAMLGPNGGAMYVRGSRSYRPSDIQTVAQLDDGSNNNSVLLRTTAAGVVSTVIVVGAALQASLAGSGSGAVIGVDQEFAAVSAWAANSFALTVNGNSPITDDDGSVPNILTLRVGSRASGASGYFGHINHIAIFSQRPDNQALQRISGANISDGPYAGQTALFFGDSITEFVDYPARVGARLGLTAVNVGFGGCRMSPTAGSDYDQLSMVRLSNAIASGDWSAQVAAVAAIAAQGDDNTAILARLMAVNWPAVSVVSIFYGTNDYGGGVPLGSHGDAVETSYRGAINHVVSTLLGAYPHLKITFATPLWRARLASGDGKDADTNPNSAGIYLIEYVDAELDQAARVKCPAIDMYRTSGINAFNHPAYLSDGLHLTGEAGSQRVADKISAFLAASY